MKVVLFCGGLGLRMRAHAEDIPKPMVQIGSRPILWHLMKYYAYYGHRDFVLCLGYKGDYIKNYFLEDGQSCSSDFVVSKGGQHLRLYSSDIDDCRITFADTGANASIGERLRAAREHVEGEEAFLANYSDGLTDLYLPEMIQNFHRHDRVAMFLSVRPNLTYDVVSDLGDGLVNGITAIPDSDIRINGGFFVFRKDIFEYLREGEDLVRKAFLRLISERQLAVYRYDGFWKCMDTFKDRLEFEDLIARGKMPWQVWNSRQSGSDGAGVAHRLGRPAMQ